MIDTTLVSFIFRNVREVVLWLPFDFKNKNEMDVRNDFKGMHVLYSPSKNDSKDSAGWNKTKVFLGGAVTYQKSYNWNDTNHMIFAVVRDPVERFISAVGTVTSEKFESGKMLRDQCLKDTASETLQCFVSLVRTQGFWIDLHFTPMVFKIAFATMGKDLPVASFPFEEVPSILANIGVNPNKKKKDGNKADYIDRSNVLMNVTINEFRADILRELCLVYKMDIWFLRYFFGAFHALR